MTRRNFPTSHVMYKEGGSIIPTCETVTKFSPAQLLFGHPHACQVAGQRRGAAVPEFCWPGTKSDMKHRSYKIRLYYNPTTSLNH